MQYFSDTYEPSLPKLALPAEIWHQIIDFVAADDVWSAGRCQFISKELRDISLSDLTWRYIYEDWTQTETDPKLTHWYTRFVNEGTHGKHWPLLLTMELNESNTLWQRCGDAKFSLVQ